MAPNIVLVLMLAERGMDDTLVVVTTDHRDMAGPHRQFDKGPFGYEELYHIRLLVRWPGVVPPGSSCDAFTSLLDLMPTFLGAAGAAVPEHLHGRDPRPVLAGGEVADWPDHLVAEYSGNEFGLSSQRILRTARYRYVHNAHDDELYDLESDRAELRDLAGEPSAADLARELQAMVWAWMADHDDPLAGPAGNFLA